MLEIRLNCENCNRSLPPTSQEAMICTYECTFCTDCVANILENVCPNCGGGFEKRPIRPKNQLNKHPPTERHIYKPVATDTFQPLKEKYRHIDPKNR